MPSVADGEPVGEPVPIRGASVARFEPHDAAEPGQRARQVDGRSQASGAGSRHSHGTRAHR